MCNGHEVQKDIIRYGGLAILWNGAILKYSMIQLNEFD